VSSARLYVFALELVMKNKFQLDELYWTAVLRNDMFRDEMQSRREELSRLMANIETTFVENSRYNDDSRSMNWTVEEMTDFCQACHSVRLKIFEYLEQITSLLGASIHII
jgi:hypothetical protein